MNKTHYKGGLLCLLGSIGLRSRSNQSLLLEEKQGGVTVSSKGYCQCPGTAKVIVNKLINCISLRTYCDYEIHRIAGNGNDR